MSGHSKWSKVKHQKEVTDAVKGKIFTKLANAITVAVRHGGGTNQETNVRLRFAIEKARASNMPKEKIERAIDRGSGDDNGVVMEEVVYEGFGPGGAGLIIEAVTDKRQRTVTLIKNVLERSGGTLAASGAVAYLFDILGEVVVEKGSASFESLLERAITANASDAVDDGEAVVLYCPPDQLHAVKMAMEQQGSTILQAERIYSPKTTLPLAAQSYAQVQQLIETLEDIDDVQRVYSAAREVTPS